MTFPNAADDGCRNCGKVMGGGLTICPHCGVSRDSSARVQVVFRVILLVFLASAAVLTFLLAASYLDQVFIFAPFDLLKGASETRLEALAELVVGLFWLVVTLLLGRASGRIIKNTRIIGGQKVANFVNEGDGFPNADEGCVACHSELPAGATFCPRCGQPVRPEEPLQRTIRRAGGIIADRRGVTASGQCPFCGVATSPEATYCPACGTRLFASGRGCGFFLNMVGLGLMAVSALSFGACLITPFTADWMHRAGAPPAAGTGLAILISAAVLAGATALAVRRRR